MGREIKKRLGRWEGCDTQREKRVSHLPSEKANAVEGLQQGLELVGEPERDQLRHPELRRAHPERRAEVYAHHGPDWTRESIHHVKQLRYFNRYVKALFEHFGTIVKGTSVCAF